MTATTPNTLGVLQSLQSLILANTGTTFAALRSGDATRYGVARAVYIGAPKDFKDGYLPQWQLSWKSLAAPGFVGVGVRGNYLSLAFCDR